MSKSSKLKPKTVIDLFLFVYILISFLNLNYVFFVLPRPVSATILTAIIFAQVFFTGIILIIKVNEIKQILLAAKDD